MNQSSSKRLYSSINPTNFPDAHASSDYARDISPWPWFLEVMGSDKLALLHEKQRAFRSRQKPGVIQAFLGAIVLLFLIAMLSTRSYYYYCNIFQTDVLFESSSSSSGEKWIDMIKELPSSESIRDMFLHYAAHPHLAGSEKDYELAQWTRDQFLRFGIKNTSIETYYPYLNYPLARRLAIISGPEDLLYEASLKETGEDSTPTFHAYSADGNVTGPIVYVNYGRLDDFELLIKSDIQVNGSICLMRHGGQITSGAKVQHAETFGCIGALIYTENQDDNTTSTVVHRDSVLYSHLYSGDPWTPGYGATLDATRNFTGVNLSKIPSLPISWNDALPLLRATQDHGFIIKNGQGHFKGQDVGYFTGPSTAMCNLVNFNEYKVKPVWNVMAHIKGREEHEKAIIIGNHRDAWDYGAADPSSGSAVLLELARVFGLLLEKGWKPRRSIILASWDANEYGNVGSTEYIEDHLSWLNKHAIAYLNVDHAVTGPHFTAQASPLLNQVLYEVTSMVIDPKTSKSVYDAWLDDTLSEKEKFTTLVQPIGSTPGLDSVAFSEHAGISSLSMSFDGNQYNVSHSIFDSVSWMEKYGDPTFEYHQTMVKIWGLLVLRLSDDLILPLYPVDYALTMKRHLEKLTHDDKQTINNIKNNNNSSDWSKLASALHAFEKATDKFEKKLQSLETKKKKLSNKQIHRVNERLVQLERAFVNHEKTLLKDRPWYKHAIFAPSAMTGILQAFPSLVESRELKDLKKTSAAEEALVDILQNAQSVLLKGNKHHHLLNQEEEDEISLEDDNDFE